MTDCAMFFFRNSELTSLCMNDVDTVSAWRGQTSPRPKVIILFDFFLKPDKTHFFNLNKNFINKTAAENIFLGLEGRLSPHAQTC